MKRLLVIGAALATVSIAPVSTGRAEVLTVGQVKALFAGDATAQAAGMAYSEGVFDGMLAMEALRRKETGEKHEFCKIFDAHDRGEPAPHPAYQTKALVDAWERRGLSMDTVFPDLALSYLSAQYGCGR